MHTRHVGLYGQWLYTWRPREGNKEDVMYFKGHQENVMYLEDDVDAGPFTYRSAGLLTLKNSLIKFEHVLCRCFNTV